MARRSLPKKLAGIFNFKAKKYTISVQAARLELRPLFFSLRPLIDLWPKTPLTAAKTSPRPPEIAPLCHTDSLESRGLCAYLNREDLSCGLSPGNYSEFTQYFFSALECRFFSSFSLPVGPFHKPD